MTKNELAKAVARQTGIDQDTVEKVLEGTTKAVRENVMKGESVFIRGFGTFGPKKRAAKTARNINAGTQVMIPERFVPFFKPAPRFSEAVNKLN